MSEWIGIKKEPRMHQRVLIWTTDYDGDPVCSMATYNGKRSGYLVDGGFKDKDVTHWMPLPEPPCTTPNY